MYSEFKTCAQTVWIGKIPILYIFKISLFPFNSGVLTSDCSHTQVYKCRFLCDMGHNKVSYCSENHLIDSDGYNGYTPKW